MSEKRRDSKGRLLKDNESQRKDGRYQFRYTDSCGERRMVYSWRLVESDPHPQGKKRDISLREKEVQIQKDFFDGISTGKGDITVNKLFDRFMANKRSISHSTRRTYTVLYDGHIRNAGFGNKGITDCKKSDVLRLYSELSTCGLSNGTIQNIHMVLFSAFQSAVEDDYIRKNPCKGCDREYPYNANDRRDSLTLLQQQNFLDFLTHDKVYSKYLLITKLVLGTGLRCGELFGLTWEDIDWKTRTINVSHQLQYDNEDGSWGLRITEPKTECSIRSIPLSQEILDLLKEHRRNTYFKSINSGVELDGYKGFLFLNRKGNAPIIPEQFTDSLNSAVKKYNKIAMMNAKENGKIPELMPKITAHILRHTACTRMAEAGMDVKVLQKIMGHSKAEITMEVYNHADFERISNEFKRVERALLLG